MTIPITKTKNGTTNLHIWRTGLTYARQNGPLYRKEWTNLYYSPLPQPPDEDKVHYVDIRQGLPFEDNTFDHIYAMHVMEHLTLKEGLAFMKEALRILKPAGICRVSTPDLENMARCYSKQLEEALKDPSEKNICNYRWAQYELIDQAVREKSGGEMIEAIKAGYYNEDHLKERYGDVYKEFIAEGARELQKEINAQLSEEKGSNGRRTLLTKVKDRIKRKVYQQKLQEVNRQLGGDPRKTVEANKWLYDRVSLRLLMEGAGFVEYQMKDYKTSGIKNWERYQFDRSKNGDHPIEPSLYAEAKKF